jgi:hypothetical protein
VRLGLLVNKYGAKNLKLPPAAGGSEPPGGPKFPHCRVTGLLTSLGGCDQGAPAGGADPAIREPQWTQKLQWERSPRRRPAGGPGPTH